MTPCDMIKGQHEKHITCGCHHVGHSPTAYEHCFSSCNLPRGPCLAHAQVTLQAILPMLSQACLQDPVLLSWRLPIARFMLREYWNLPLGPFINMVSPTFILSMI